MDFGKAQHAMENAAVTARDSSQTELAFSAAEKSLQFLADAASRLESRLTPVLRGPSPATQQGEARPRMDVQLAEGVMSFADRAVMVGHQLEDITARLGI